MLSAPKKGDRVQVWYGPKWRDYMPLHGKCGHVVIVSMGRPRNHGIRIEGIIHGVPAGNLRKPK